MIPPKKTQRGHQNTKKVHWVTEHIQQQFQKKFVPGKNIAIDGSTLAFKRKIVFKIYNLKQ
jgi:hypothetical protein